MVGGRRIRMGELVSRMVCGMSLGCEWECFMRIREVC